MKTEPFFIRTLAFMRKKNAPEDNTNLQDSKDYFANWWTMLVTQPCQAVKKIATKQSRQYVYACGSTSGTNKKECWHGFPVFVAITCSMFSHITMGRR